MDQHSNKLFVGSCGISSRTYTFGNGTKIKVLVTLDELNAKIVKSPRSCAGTNFPWITWLDQINFRLSRAITPLRMMWKTNRSVQNFILPTPQDQSIMRETNNGTLTTFTVSNNLLSWKMVWRYKWRMILKKGIEYQSVHREKFGILDGIFWSPSGKLLAFYRMDQTMVTEYPIMEIGNVPATARMIRYPIWRKKSPCNFRSLQYRNRQDNFPSNRRTGEQYLTNVAWSPDNQSIYIAVVNREQNHLKMVVTMLQQVLLKKLCLKRKWEMGSTHAPINLCRHADQFIWQSERWI